MAEKILVVDDEESLRFTFEAFLTESGYPVTTAASFEEGLAILADNAFELVYIDIMLGRRSGLELLQEIRNRYPTCPVVMITGAPQVDTAAEAVRRGAFDYIPKPIRQETLLRVTKMALHHKQVVDQREEYRAHLEAIFRCLQEGLLLVDRQGRIRAANHAFCQMLGMSQDLIGLQLGQLPRNVREALVELFEETLHGGTRIEVRRLELINPAQQRQVLTVSTDPWTDAAQVVQGVVLTVRDETRLEVLERSLSKRRKFEHIIGRSQAMQTVFGLIESLAEVDTTVLVTGESGTGKELVAEALHFRSARHRGPLVKVNCAALPENLLESELFGHLKGSFTGALKDKVGRFEQADGGTIFLDEIGDISPALQVRLLRVLQNKEVEKVGSGQSFQVDVRIVAATNQNLWQKVRKGEFREDLYYRLRVVQVPIPPLRDRRDDIPLLIDHFIQKFSQRFNRPVPGIAEQALEFMTGYSWPGNIRELENAIEHAFVLCRGATLEVEHLPPELSDPNAGDRDVREEEREELLDALEKSGWNKSKAAKLLGCSRRTIYRKMEEFEIDHPESS